MVKDLAERFEREHVATHAKPSTACTYRWLTKDFILTAFDTKPVASVTRADVAKMHHKMRETPRQANQTLAVLSKMFTLAEVCILDTPPRPAARPDYPPEQNGRDSGLPTGPSTCHALTAVTWPEAAGMEARRLGIQREKYSVVPVTNDWRRSP